MGKDSKIAWTDHTWNPWVGCSKVSAGCENCYMFRDAKRYGNDPAEIKRTGTKTFLAPTGWDPGKVFVCSWSDFFHPEVPELWRKDAMDVMWLNSQHTYLLLTKRPENIREMFEYEWFEDFPNIWLGVTVENQENVNRMSLLYGIPVTTKFVSAEPLIGELDLSEHLGLTDWVIVGGESGPNCRPMNPEWARTIRDQCEDHGVPFFMKQMSGNTKALREDIPEDLMIREFPE